VSANIDTFPITPKYFESFFYFFSNTIFLYHRAFFITFTLLKHFRAMELTGTIKKISDLQTFNSGFQKKEMVLLTEEQYPQPINIEFLSEKVDLLNQYKVGDKVKVHINIRGREWTSPQGEVKYFNSITAWRMEKDGGSDFNEPTEAAPSQQGPATDNKNVFADDEDDDLPF